MKTLNEELEAVKDDNTIIGAKPPKVRTLFDVVKTGNYSLEDFKKSKELVAPEFESDINVRVREGISRGVQDIKNVPQGVEIFGGQVEMKIGGWAGSEETVERGRNLIKTAIDELDAKEKNYYQSAIPMSSKDYESLSFGLGQGITNYGAMLATGYLGGAVAGIGSMAVLEGTQKAQEKIGYYTEKTGDKELKGYTPEQAGKDVALTAIYTAGSAIMEKKLGYGAQRKLFKMPVGEKIKNVVLTGLSEGGTETLQELYATGIDFVGGYIDSSKLPERFLGAVQEGVIGGILGGTAGIAAAVNHRSQAKQILRENLQNTVPQKDLENVVNAVYESTSDSMANIITQELAQSEQLRNKHGAIYESLKSEVARQIQDNGAYSDVDEMKLSQYIEGTAKMFADQVLGEANNRGVVIDDVLKSSEIVYKDGRLYLQGVTQEEKAKKTKRKKIQKRIEKQAESILNPQKTELSYEEIVRKLRYEDLTEEQETNLQEMLEKEEDRLRPLLDTAQDVALEIDNEFGLQLGDIASAITEKRLNFKEAQDLWGDYLPYNDLELLGEKIKERDNKDGDPAKIGYDYYTEKVYDAFDDINAKANNYILLQQSFDVADENARLDDIYPEYKGETININGQEKTVYNSNGDRIAKSKEALENFYKWFGDSKVVDEQGRPLSLFRGDLEDIEIFDESKQRGGNLGRAFYFTTDKEYARQYSGYNETGREPRAYYLKLNNPLIVGKEGYVRAILNNFPDAGNLNTQQQIKEFLQDKGIDGVIWDRGNKVEYAVYSPNQIKSTSNRGTYSESENIYYQSAFAGSRVDYDRPSLEAIGSGEGNQAHGWGLYYALNKDVAERYKDAFIRQERQSVFPNSPEELAIKTYLKNNKNKEATIKELSQIEKDESKKFGTQDENILAYTNAAQAQDYIRYVEDGKLEKQIQEVENSSKGQVHEVDIPESPYLLDEQKPFSEQSDYVKERLEKIFSNLPEKYLENYPKMGLERVKELDFLGSEIYGTLEEAYGSPKEASKTLEKYGIKGITYFGQQDGRAFVIFNPDDVKVIQKFYQVKNLPKQKGKIKGAFDALTKSIEITSEADFSTYQHEFAHYWLDNIWNYAQSGKASPEYMKRFNEIKKWLGVKGDYPTRTQHEKFARAYEKYLYRGEYANPIIGDTFREYEDFIREVYSSIAEIDTRAGVMYKPVPKLVYDFFNSMVSGTLPYYGGIDEPKEVVEKETKEVKEFVKEEQKVLAENTQNYALKPVQTDTETGYLTAYKKMTGEEVEAGVVNLEKEQEKAEKFVNENPDLAKQIVDGVAPVPDGMLKNTIYLAYDKLQKRLGNTQNRVNSLMNQALELRRMGQEISSQRLAYRNETSPLYWIQTVQDNKASALADSNKMTVKELNDLVNKSIKDGMKQGKTAKEIAKDLREQLGVTQFYQEEVYPTEETEQASYNYIYKYVNQQLGLSMTMEEAETITRKADDMLSSLENSKAPNGNPSVEYFVKQKDLENYANSIAPSSQARVLVSVVGRGNLLSSIKSPLTNVISNAYVGAYRSAVRRIMLGQYESIVSPELIKQNKQYSWEIFRKTGYNVNNITPETPRNTILGEKLTHSEGEGKIRALGRFYENLIYKWSLGAGDVIFKDYAFTDYAALKATKESGGDVNKANEIFKDACLIEPQTELGQQIRDEAIQESLIATYQNKGLISDKALKARQAMDFGVGFGEFVAPFVKTPANVVSMGLKAGFGSVKAVASEIQRDIKAGKIQKPTKENIELVVQNGLGVLVASLLLGAIDDEDYMPPYALATNKDKQLAKELNIAYNSIRIGNTWVSLDYLGPLASPLVGLLQARREDGILNSIFGYAKSGMIQSLSIPAFGNIADIFTDIQNTVRKDGADVAADTLNDTIQAVYSRTIPSIVSDVAKMLDKYDRETKGHEIKAKIPLVRESLPKKVSVTSGRAESLDSPIQELLFGARAKTQVVNPVAKELQRLNNEGYGVSLTPVTQRGKLSEVDDKTKEKVRQDFAKEYSKQVGNLIKSASYKRMDNEDKQQAIDKIRRKTVEALKKRYLK